MTLIAPVVSDPGTGRTVVFFPHAGGSPRFVRHLAEALPGHRVFGVTYPGRDHLIDDTPITDMRVLAERVAGEVVERFGDHTDPLLLVGHSLGAFVAYETAVVLSRLPFPVPVTVVASGQNPPIADRPGHGGGFGELSDDEIIADVVRQNPASRDVWRNAELRSFFLPTVRADYRLLGDYRPSGARVDEVRVIVAADDREVDFSTLGQWQRFSDRPTDITIVDGAHFYLERPDTQLARFLTDVTSRREQGEVKDHV